MSHQESSLDTQEFCSLEHVNPNCMFLKVMNLSQYRQSDFPACWFLFPWVPLPNFWISRFVGPILLKLSSMVGLSNHPRQKVDFSTHEWELGTKFCSYTLQKKSQKERWNKLIADWAQKIQWLIICAQSVARTQMGSWTSPLKVCSQGLFRPSGKLSLAPRACLSTDFARFICLSPRLSAPGSPRMIRNRPTPFTCSIVLQMMAGFRNFYSL